MATYFAGDFNSLRLFVFTFSLFARRDWGTIVTTMEAATERANAGLLSTIIIIITRSYAALRAADLD